MILKELQEDPISGAVCPYCGEYNADAEGFGITGDEGSFFSCAYCHEFSVSIFVGGFFTFRGTVFEIARIEGSGATEIAVVEVRRPGASPLWKPNRRDYQYFSRGQIVNAMSEAWPAMKAKEGN